MPDAANLDIYQGDDYVATILVTDASGNAVNLTGYTIQAQMRLGPADSNPTIAVEIVCALTPPNQITITIPHATTKTLAGRYMWDLQLVNASNIITTILAGGVSVTPEITRETGNLLEVAAPELPRYVNRMFRPLPQGRLVRIA